MKSNKKIYLLWGAVFGLSIISIGTAAFYQLNKAGEESCFVSLKAFIEKTIIKNREDLPFVKSITTPNWYTLSKQETKIILDKAVKSGELDCSDIYKNYKNDTYWGEDYLISIRINESTKNFEVMIK